MKRAIILGLIGLAASLPGQGSDRNQVDIIGNVWAISREVHFPGTPPVDAMTVYSDARVEIGPYVVVSFRCPAGLGCFDPWWLSSRCNPQSTVTHSSPGSLAVVTCVPHSSLDGTAMGACVEVIGHLSPDRRTGDLAVYPDRIEPLQYWMCDTKP